MTFCDAGVLPASLVQARGSHHNNEGLDKHVVGF